MQLATQTGKALGRIVQGVITGWQAFFAIDAQSRQRLALVGLAIALQSALDLPRDGLRALLGPGIGLLVMAILLASIVLLISSVVAADRPDSQTNRRLTTVALVLSLGASIIGLRQVGAMVIASFSPPVYVNDGTSLDHYAAELLLQGHNPYTNSSMVAALRFLDQPGQYSTPLRAGSFAGRGWLDYPSDADRAAIVTNTSSTNTPELESRVSYPALSFLALVPFVWAGLPSVTLFTLLCLGVFAFVALRAVSPEVRPWLGLVILADAPVLNNALVGGLDVATMLLLFLAWLWWERMPWGMAMMGLALATKQQAWFFLPFYAIFLYQRVGLRETATRLAGAGAIFLAINLPFILWDAHAWVAGVLAPVSDPMFPRGNGLMQLSLAGVIPLLPERAYTVLEGLAMLAAIGWYAKWGARRWPELVFVIALLPLWFAWRSLTTYFYFGALPIVALWLAWRFPTRVPAEGQA